MYAHARAYIFLCGDNIRDYHAVVTRQSFFSYLVFYFD